MEKVNSFSGEQWTSAVFMACLQTMHKELGPEHCQLQYGQCIKMNLE